ncbi:MAG: Rrf2 family transcriptional regulator [Chloroflexi bacterium]|nr:Rrf2 family transcriptional regulator [Chloroflexota bacterium]
MRLTMRSDYGAHAVIELAARFGQGPVQSADIATRQKIPLAYLDQLLATLRRAGIVRSTRGPHGGHELARRPHDLTLGDVVTALEGPVVPTEFVHAPSTQAGGQDRLAGCAVRNTWHAAAVASQRVLDATSIADLLAEQQHIRLLRGEPCPTAVAASGSAILVAAN